MICDISVLVTSQEQQKFVLQGGVEKGVGGVVCILILQLFDCVILNIPVFSCICNSLACSPINMKHRGLKWVLQVRFG